MAAVKALFQNPSLSWLWTVIRVYVGYQWLEAGLGKISNPAWVGANAGTAIGGFFQGAIAKATGDHPAVQGWYASFLESVAVPNAVFFSYLIAFAEFAVGVALILGLFTTLAAFGGALMNLNFMLAGTTSTNPILYTLAILLLAAGANAGLIGLDRWVRPYIQQTFGKGQTAASR